MCDAKTEPGMNHIFFLLWNAPKKWQVFTAAHLNIYFHTFLIIVFIYDLAISTCVTLYCSTLRAHYHTPSQQHVHAPISTRKYDTYDAPLILMKQWSDENKDIFSSTKTLVIYEKFIVQAELGLCQSSIPGPPMYHFLSLGSSVVDPRFSSKRLESKHITQTVTQNYNRWGKFRVTH